MHIYNHLAVRSNRACEKAVVGFALTLSIFISMVVMGIWSHIHGSQLLLALTLLMISCFLLAAVYFWIACIEYARASAHEERVLVEIAHVYLLPNPTWCANVHALC